MDKLQMVLNEHNHCQILCLSEHWQSAEEFKMYDFQNFKLVANFCRQKGHHGGVAIYTKNEINWKERTDITSISEAFEFECTTIEGKINNISTSIICKYITSNQKNYILHKIEQICIYLNTESIFVIVDFNIFFEIKKYRKIFNIAFKSFNITQTINEPTRINNKCKSCIDNIC